MSAYFIFIRDKTTNPAELKTYSEMAGPTVAGRPLTIHAFYGKQEVLEGPPSEGTVIFEFPTMAEARAWYDSPGYQAAKVHRMAGSDYRVLLVEGVSPAEA